MVERWQVEVEGRVLPASVADDPALELCNTLAGWHRPPSEQREYLHGHGDLVAWAEIQGLLDSTEATRAHDRGAAQPDRAARVLARTRWFRADLRRAVVTPDARSLAPLVGWAAMVEPARAVAVADGGLRWVLSPADDLDLPLVAAVATAVDFLADDHPRVAACPGSGCGWVFANPSGRRKWCSMAVCGNRAKVAAHAARMRSD